MSATTAIERPPAAIRAEWLGRCLCHVFLLFLVVDAVTKLVPAECMSGAVAQAAQGANLVLSRGLSLLTVVCALLYASPRTSAVGATLLNGLLGGAIAASSHAAGQAAKKIRPRSARPVDFAQRRSSSSSSERRARHCSPRRHPASSHARS